MDANDVRLNVHQQGHQHGELHRQAAGVDGEDPEGSESCGLGVELEYGVAQE